VLLNEKKEALAELRYGMVTSELPMVSLQACCRTKNGIADLGTFIQNYVVGLSGSEFRFSMDENKSNLFPAQSA